MQPVDLAILTPLDALLQEGSVTLAARRLGLSTPAMSHALSRMRERLEDPLLVRAGRGMVLTPRAQELKPRVHALVEEATRALAVARPFLAAQLEQSFKLVASDHVLTVLGVELDRLVHLEAPRVSLRFVPNAPDDAQALREGSVDLAVGIYGELPPELRTRQLLTDRFVCVVREGHPTVKRRLTLADFLALEHLQVAPRGQPGGYLDDVLAAKGLTRRVARAVPFFLGALQLVARTDYVLTVSERIARAMGPALGLKLFEPPLPLAPYALKLVWHPRFDGDAAHGWLREVMLRAAKHTAGDVHPGARTSLRRAAR